MSGIDKHANVISSDWFPDERYASGQSFTGKVVVPSTNSAFGEPQMDRLPPQRIHRTPQPQGVPGHPWAHSGGAVAVPLNGRHRTYGVLEVINRVDEAGTYIRGGRFKRSEVLSAVRQLP